MECTRFRRNCTPDGIQGPRQIQCGSRANNTTAVKMLIASSGASVPQATLVHVNRMWILLQRIFIHYSDGHSHDYTPQAQSPLRVCDQTSDTLACVAEFWRKSSYVCIRNSSGASRSIMFLSRALQVPTAQLPRDSKRCMIWSVA